MRRPARALLAAVLLLMTLSMAAIVSSTHSSTALAGTYAPPRQLRVAVVRSQTTLTWLANRGTPSHYPHGGKETATLNYLRQRGYNVTEIIGDRDLNMDTLRKYDVVVMPLVFAISKKASENLVHYVAEGGGLVSSLSSPRAEPEKANPPGTKNDMREWWWRQFSSNDWEWGPLSQVYQARFSNDNFTPKFRIHPVATSQITTGAQAILGARGLSSALSGMTLLRDPGAGVELSRPILSDADASAAATFEILDSKVKRDYPAIYSGAITSRYYSGRSVYFYFSVTDFLPTYSTANYRIPTSAGTPQGEVAGALLESAIQWAGTKDGVTGATASRIGAYANVKSSGSGMSWTVYLKNYGPLTAYGTLRLRIYDPKGRLVHTYIRNPQTSVQPGTSQKFSGSWGHGIGGGQYSVKVTYDYGYPMAATQACTRANISRGHQATTK